MNDVHLYNVMFKEGKLDPAPMVAAVREGAFDLVLLTRLATPERTEGQGLAEVVAAVREHYHVLGEDPVYSYYVR